MKSHITSPQSCKGHVAQQLRSINSTLGLLSYKYIHMTKTSLDWDGSGRKMANSQQMTVFQDFLICYV